MFLRILFIFCFFSSCVFSQKAPFLYKITKEGQKESYVFGTMHIVPDSVFYFPKKVEKILKSCDELVMEIDDKIDQAKMQELMVLKEGSCFDIFTPIQKDSVLEWLSKATGLTTEMCEKSYTTFKPLILIQMSIAPMMQQKHKLIEAEITQLAKEKKLAISGLETMEFQLSVFDNMSDSVMAEMVLTYVRDPENKEMTKLVDAYNSRDLNKINELFITENTFLTPEELLDKRNKNWIPQINDKSKFKALFIAVGAAHLGGENGILSLLKLNGYTVEPIFY